MAGFDAVLMLVKKFKFQRTNERVEWMATSETERPDWDSLPLGRLADVKEFAALVRLCERRMNACRKCTRPLGETNADDVGWQLASASEKTVIISCRRCWR
jgi:hypothetical protein